MTRLEQIEAALRAADAAGNTEDAKALAQAYAQERAAQGPSFAGVKSGMSSVPTEQKTTYNPTNAHGLDGVTSQVGGALDSLTHHVMKVPLGLAQLAGHGLNAGIQAVAGGSDYANGVQSRMQQQDQSVIADEQAYQARNPNNTGANVGAVAGEVLPWLVGTGELRAAGMLPKVKALSQVPSLLGKAGNVGARVGLLGTEGAVAGGAQPVTEQGDFASQKARQIGLGAVTNVALGAGAELVPAGLRVGKGALDYLTPAGQSRIASRRFAKMLEGDPQAVAALQNAPRDVNGVDYSLSSVLTHNPKYLQYERALRANPHAVPAFLTQAQKNNEARMAVVGGLKGSDGELKAAIEARRTNSAAFRDPHLPEEGSKLIDPAPIVAVLKKKALDANTAVRGAATEHLRLIEQHMAENGGKVPAYALDDMNQQAGKTLSDFSKHGVVGTQEEARYAPVKNAFTDTLHGELPGYRDYLAAYARDSAPINDMEAARGLANSGAFASRDFSNSQVLDVNALKRAIRLDDKANHPMSPEARAKLDAVLESKLRENVANQKVGPLGSNTEADQQARGLLDRPFVHKTITGAGALAGGLLGHMGVPGMGGVSGSIVGGLLAEGAQASRGNILGQLGRLTANAEEARKAIELARRLEQKRQQSLLTRVPQYLLPYSH